MSAVSGVDRLLEIRTLRTWFHTRSGIVKSVDGVSLSLDRGEVLGLVGESGSGKTTLLNAISTRLPPTSGTVEYRMRDGQLRDLFAEFWVNDAMTVDDAQARYVDLLSIAE